MLSLGMPTSASNEETPDKPLLESEAAQSQILERLRQESADASQAAETLANLDITDKPQLSKGSKTVGNTRG